MNWEIRSETDAHLFRAFPNGDGLWCWEAFEKTNTAKPITSGGPHPTLEYALRSAECYFYVRLSTQTKEDATRPAATGNVLHFPTR